MTNMTVIHGGEGDFLSLDALWREAIALKPKRITIEMPPFFDHRAKVVIKVERSGGTQIEAVGLHDDVLVAFDIALKEARLLTGR